MTAGHKDLGCLGSQITTAFLLGTYAHVPVYPSPLCNITWLQRYIESGQMTSLSSGSTVCMLKTFDPHLTVGSAAWAIINAMAGL